MADTDYIYAGASATLATHQLLSLNQRELLRNTKSVTELQNVLRETHFAPYINSEKTLSACLDTALLDAKRHMLRIAPAGNTVRLFFLRYDYANTAHLLHASEQNRTEEEALRACSPFGMYSPVQLYARIQAGKLHVIDPHLAEIARATKKTNQHALKQYGSHILFDLGYLERAMRIAQELQNNTLSWYVSLQADMYTIRTILLTGDSALWSAVGTLEKRHFNREQLVSVLATRDASTPWQRLFAEHAETGDYTKIEKALDDYHTKQLKHKAIDQQSLAPLLLYLHTFIENIQYIRTIHTAHVVGMDTETLHALIRTPASSYAY